MKTARADGQALELAPRQAPAVTSWPVGTFWKQVFSSLASFCADSSASRGTRPGLRDHHQETGAAVAVLQSSGAESLTVSELRRFSQKFSASFRDRVLLPTSGMGQS